ncbi:hypothetical protein HID58_024320 [Brassica napus]|uniref:KIB1-4 beta-propeller domain-containing protein n=2 Tax=Brassica napus TaxID=3708 RepID=A0ABQ8D4M5_BRANA|nr:hypothetical protein HID58_024320 [Brassica napus]
MFQLNFKPSVFRNVIRHTTNSVRMFSSSTPTFPFMLIDYLTNFSSVEDDGPVTKWYGSSPPNCYNQKEILIRDLKLREEVLEAMTSGFSRNQSFGFYDYYQSDSGDNPHILLKHKPSNPELTEVSAQLPPLPCGTKIQNIAMSSFSNRRKDWAVCVKLPGSQLSLCRPFAFGQFKWINIKPMPESISSFSSIMFSKKDQRFYIPSPGGNHLCSLDLNFKEGDMPRFLRIGFEDYPKSVVSELEELNSCSRTDHIVESPTGELFYIKWYGEEYEGEDLDRDENYNDVVRSLTHKTKKFMVFREKETGYAEEKKNEVIIYTEEDDKTMTYTEDIGDLCIFVGHSQAYCVPASSSPGLKPNCIYFVGYSFGVYDLTTKTCTTFFTRDADEEDNEIAPLRRLDFPYWPPPFPISC